MKCRKCNKNNVRQAHYCTHCGNKYTKKEMEEAKNHGIIPKLLKIKDWYDTLTLSKITGSIYWKVGSILVVLLIGIMMILSNGRNFHILEDDHYDVVYNSKKKEYYLYTKDEEINVLFYLPHEVETIQVKSYNSSNKVQDSKTIKDLSELKVSISNHDNLYYKVTFDKDSKNTIKFYVLKK